MASKSRGKGGARDRHMSDIDRRLRISTLNTFVERNVKQTDISEIGCVKVVHTFWNTIRAASPVVAADRSAARTVLKAWASLRRVAISWAIIDACKDQYEKHSDQENHTILSLFLSYVQFATRVFIFAE